MAFSIQDLEQAANLATTVKDYWPVALVALLLGLDKAGYYLKRKGTNGKPNTNGAKDLATELVKQLSGQAQKQDGDDTRFIPGFSPTCVEHSNKIVEILTEMPHIKEGINEIKTAQAKTSRKVDQNIETVKLMFGNIDKGLKEIKNGGN
jgi:hypothetical protein